MGCCESTAVTQQDVIAVKPSQAEPSPRDSPQSAWKNVTVQRIKSISNEMNSTQIFQALDADKSGFIESNEFPHIVEMLNLKLSEAEVKSIFKRFDLNHDGKLDLKEFKKLMTESIEIACSPSRNRIKTISNEMNSTAVFQALDADKSNFIEFNEFPHIVEMLNIKLSEAELSSIFTKFDLNHDGKLDLKEFKKLMTESIDVACSPTRNRIRTVSDEMNATQIFQSLDVDKSNFIEINEFPHIVEMLNIRLSQGELRSIFKKFDRNHDDKLDLKEFKQMLSESIDVAGSSGRN